MTGKYAKTNLNTPLISLREKISLHSHEKYTRNYPYNIYYSHICLYVIYITPSHKESYLVE